MKILKLHSDQLTDQLKGIIRIAVRVLAILMTGVVVWGVIDVAWLLHQKAMLPPRFIFTINDMLAAFGAFLAVLIAIEIFINIT